MLSNMAKGCAESGWVDEEELLERGVAGGRASLADVTGSSCTSGGTDAAMGWVNDPLAGACPLVAEPACGVALLSGGGRLASLADDRGGRESPACKGV
jgi:hypothetical protein